MDEFIKSVTQRLGIDQSTASNAVGSLLGVLKKEGDKGAVGDLLKKLPGADALVNSAGSGGQGQGGLLGKLGGMVGGLTGGGAGGLAGLAASGLSGDKIRDLVRMFVDWAKKKAGPEVVEKAINSVPALKNLLK